MDDTNVLVLASKVIKYCCTVISRSVIDCDEFYRLGGQRLNQEAVDKSVEKWARVVDRGRTLAADRSPDSSRDGESALTHLHLGGLRIWAMRLPARRHVCW
ncbi:hypothetical protein [Brevibacterium aurantiacum]|uniref:Uncharacterized protein n=1 Tax=Brevibacterium aurantiacum TaxID=273384 RepID=A0A3T0DT77_BREAU|nr:hypothetical protein [Brevibacterium aurantiacum]AZT98293.1 hypothetical protein CXR27_15795 [Brevibacterium aurantiacum]